MPTDLITGWSSFIVGALLLAAPGPLGWLNRRITGHPMDGGLGCGLVVAGLVMMLFGAARLV